LARRTRLQDNPPPATPLNQLGPGLGPSEATKATSRSPDWLVWSAEELIAPLGTSWSELAVASMARAAAGGPHVGTAPESTGTPTATAMNLLTNLDQFQRRIEGLTFHRMRAGLRLITW
jgi:hypothetical protein